MLLTAWIGHKAKHHVTGQVPQTHSWAWGGAWARVVPDAQLV